MRLQNILGVLIIMMLISFVPVDKNDMRLTNPMEIKVVPNGYRKVVNKELDQINKLPLIPSSGLNLDQKINVFRTRYIGANLVEENDLRGFDPNALTETVLGSAKAMGGTDDTDYRIRSILMRFAIPAIFPTGPDNPSPTPLLTGVMILFDNLETGKVYRSAWAGQKIGFGEGDVYQLDLGPFCRITRMFGGYNTEVGGIDFIRFNYTNCITDPQMGASSLGMEANGPDFNADNVSGTSEGPVGRGAFPLESVNCFEGGCFYGFYVVTTGSGITERIVGLSMRHGVCFTE